MYFKSVALHSFRNFSLLRLSTSDCLFKNRPQYSLFVNVLYSTDCSKSTGGKGGTIKVVYKPYITPPKEAHDYKNMRLKRPMSPHLTIIAPTLTSTTSISQRISGVILSFYTFLLSFGGLLLPGGINSYISLIQGCDFSRPTLFLLKIILALPFTFHFFNAIRFIGFSLNKWLSLKDIYHTAKISFICTAVLTILFALL